jgi:branched-chain amino acid aminotransferase
VRFRKLQFFVTSVTDIHFRGEDIFPLERNGKYTTLLRNWLKAITYGKEHHNWAVVVNEIGFKVDVDTVEKEVQEMAAKLREMKNNPAFSVALQRVQNEV